MKKAGPRLPKNHSSVCDFKNCWTNSSSITRVPHTGSVVVTRKLTKLGTVSVHKSMKKAGPREPGVIIGGSSPEGGCSHSVL